MAVTKTHPIKSTLKAAIDYILNPEKTDGKLLASSFGCGLETADIEFAWTREAAGDRGTHLGRHLIQSFAVGETTPEEAHKIGMELAGAVLGGKYEFVLTTHVDKDHLHNHLIFNAVSFVDYKKYHSNKQSYHFIRRTSDRICKEHGLSVVVPGQDKGKSYAEYTAEKQGTSYKAKLKTAIDTLIPQVKDFDELLRRLQEMGYEIKQGKYISFRAAGQERFTRTKTLGAAYTEEAIKERIKGVYVAKTKTLREDKKIRLVVDLENSIKAQQSAGYERWAKIHNLKQAAKSMNFLTENKIEYYSELESKIADIMTAHDAAAKAVKEVEQRIEFAADNKRLGQVLYALAHSSLRPEFSIEYTVADVEKCKNELLHKAIEDSIQKAQVLTTAANVKLGEIQAIDYSWGEIDFVTKPLNEMRLMECTECEMSAPGAYDIDIEADDINVTDTATVIWEIA